MTKSVNIIISTIKNKYKVDDATASRIYDTCIRLHSDIVGADTETAYFVLNVAHMITTLSDRVEQLQGEVDKMKAQKQMEA